jgi:anti-sigma regulatory factor (Ser/Thr protein kinase)
VAEGPQIYLADGPESVARARHFVTAELEKWDCADPGRVVTLLTSEVVTNAICHAGGPVGLSLALVDDHTVRVEVTDGVPGSLVEPPPEARDAGGRGLHIVDTLARRWGTERHPRYKSVWFELPVERRPSKVG